MPATTRTPPTVQPGPLFPTSTDAASAVTAARAKRKAAFDACTTAMTKLVGDAFGFALARPTAGQLEQHPDEKRFELKLEVPFEDLFGGARATFNAAAKEFTDVDEDGVKTLLRASVIQEVNRTLLAQEYTHIHVSEDARDQTSWSGNRNVTHSVAHLVVSASFPDGT